MKIILTHPKSDFDAVASLLGAHKLDPSATPVLDKRLNRNVRDFLALYRSALPFTHAADIRARDVTAITLVDTQRIPEIRGLNPDGLPITIIDHHPLDDDRPANATETIDAVGANATLMVEAMQVQRIALSSLEATLLALGIYEDTGSLSYGATTPRDLRAATWLLEQRAVLDTVRRFLSPPLTPEQLQLYDALLESVETRRVQGYEVIISTAALDDATVSIAGAAHYLSDALDPAALFVVVALPDYVQVTARASADAIDVGEIARTLGGGGHARAAAASVRGQDAGAVVAALWSEVEQRARPAATVADLMSYGVRTVEADALIADVIGELRRVGHEGYPVLDAGQVVGLLTLRDADRALEHGLKRAAIREVMSAGSHTLTPHDSVAALERLIVDSGWGQIPVRGDDGGLLGIVTRTDLITHWVASHPTTASAQPTVSFERMDAVLGTGVTTLIREVAAYGQQHGLNLYMVGGVVRDLLLGRRNDDIDFVVESNGDSNAITFAEGIAALHGGQVSSYQPFGTAKWRLVDSAVAATDRDSLPEHIDFATARNEFYRHPTALPTVYTGSIKLDLHRRDFTINTLAVQLSPSGYSGRVLDFYGGLTDLDQGIIRVLHSLSFVDDPTRVLRAIRFQHRLGFALDPRTAELIDHAEPMLRRITGERVRNELNLFLKEPDPERGLRELADRRVLAGIHPALALPDGTEADFRTARNLPVDWLPSVPLRDLYWNLWLRRLPPDDVRDICDRLLIGKAECDSLVSAAHLHADPGALADPSARPSAIVARLDDLPDVVLVAAWLTGDDVIRERVQQYVMTWRYVKPATTGHTLREIGLPPGPQYARILERLRAARLDGEAQNEQDERDILQLLIQQLD